MIIIRPRLLLLQLALLAGLAAAGCPFGFSGRVTAAPSDQQEQQSQPQRPSGGIQGPRRKVQAQETEEVTLDKVGFRWI